MSDDRTREPANDSTTPAPAKGASLTDAEANRQLGQGEMPHAVHAPGGTRGPEAATQGADETAPEGSQTVKVGARDIVRPTGSLDAADAVSGEDDLSDRLAKKDNTPAGPGGQVGVA